MNPFAACALPARKFEYGGKCIEQWVLFCDGAKEATIKGRLRSRAVHANLGRTLSVVLNELTCIQRLAARTAVEQMQVVARHQQNVALFCLNRGKAGNRSKKMSLAHIVIGNQVAVRVGEIGCTFTGVN